MNFKAHFLAFLVQHLMVFEKYLTQVGEKDVDNHQVLLPEHFWLIIIFHKVRRNLPDRQNI